MSRNLIARRRDQVGYLGAPIAADQIIGGIIFCGSSEGRKAWIERLNKHHWQKFNYFVCYRDTQCQWALQFGHATWIPLSRSTPYVSH